MEEEFYGTVKLKSGEEIFAKVSASEESNETVLLLLSPVIISELKDKSDRTKGYKVEPWLKTVDEDLILIKMTDVITVIENTNKDMIGLYDHYISSYNSRIGNYSKISKEMGYVSSLKDAVTMLEKLYNSN